jgi:membrane-bound serine protease (ClpP class)
VAGALLAACAAALLAGTAGAAQSDSKRGIAVVQVEGLLDPPNAALVKNAVADANEQRRTMLLLQVDSPGAVVDVAPLVRAISRSRVPVVAWVGPTGGEARGGAALLVEAANRAFVSQGSSIGPVTPLRMDDPGRFSKRDVRELVLASARSNGRDDANAGRIVDQSLSAEDAKRAGATNGSRPTIGEVIVNLDGTTVTTASGAVHLSTAKVIGKGNDRRRQPNQDVVFEGLGLGAQVEHSLISPAAAYFLLIAGLALIVFEFFAASVGFAGVVGAIAVVGACYGFSHLPVHWWAFGLLLLSALAFAIDAQAGGLGFWTGVGAVALVAGSLTLYGGDSELRPAWWIVLIVILGTAAFYVFAVPSFIRARFSTPTIGREGMIGELGKAEVPVAPDGVVLIRDARWRARTNRATPIAAGDSVRVVSVEGTVLEVEPEAGGAKDYRDRARKRASSED